MRTIVIIVVSFIAGFVVASTGATPSASPRVTAGTSAPAVQPAVATPAATREAVTFTGSDNSSTRPVALSGNYTIGWASQTDSRSGGNFVVELEPVSSSGSSGLLVNSIFEKNTAHSGTTQIYNRKGDYYFKVVGGGDWTIKVLPL